jgi:hypothetical protein
MGDYTHSQMREDIARLETELGVAEPSKTVRQEIRDVITAPKGSDVAKARRTLGWMLILFGLFGIPVLFFAILLISGAIVALF